jgi:hypothetical protein
MSGGEISGNTSVTDAGGVRVQVGTFTMNGGKISGNTANTDGGGVLVSGGGTFAMSSGEISGNTAARNGSGVRVTGTGSVFNISGGVVAGAGANVSAVVSGTYNLNTAAPRNAVILAWNRPAGTPNYTVGSSTNLTVSSGATAVWANQGGILGVSYNHGTNRGWLRLF